MLDSGAKEIFSKTEWALGGMHSWCLTVWVLATILQKIKSHLGQGGWTSDWGTKGLRHQETLQREKESGKSPGKFTAVGSNVVELGELEGYRRLMSSS